MRGLKHSGEYALILSEDELVLFKAVWAVPNDELRAGVKTALVANTITELDHFTADSQLQTKIDADIYMLISELLDEFDDEFQTQI